MQSSFGKNANAGKYFHEQEYYFFFNLTSHIPDVSILSVWEEKLFFFLNLFFHQYNYMDSRRILVSEIIQWKDNSCIHFLQQV